LTREKEDILAQRTEALEAHAERRARARGRRKKLTLIVFFIVLIIGGVVSPGFGPLLSCAWILGLIAIPGFVFRSIRMPLDSRQRIMDEYDARLAPVERQLQANRSILEILPI
jgi:Flp pilus assembly protein TadB